MLTNKNMTYLLTPWCRVLLEKLIVLQLVKKFPTFHGTRRFITALTSVRHLSLSWASPIQSIYPQPTSWRSILILSTHLRLVLHSGLLPSGFPTKTLHIPSPHPYEPHGHKNMTRVRKSAVVQTVQRKMSVNGKFINRSSPSPCHVTQRLKRVQNVPASGFFILTSNKNSTHSFIPLSRSFNMQPNHKWGIYLIVGLYFLLPVDISACPALSAIVLHFPPLDHRSSLNFQPPKYFCGVENRRQSFGDKFPCNNDNYCTFLFAKLYIIYLLKDTRRLKYAKESRGNTLPTYDM